MQIEVSRRTALKYGLIGAAAAALAACGGGGGSSSLREQALRKWVVGTWDVTMVLGRGTPDTGTVTVKDDGTWTSTVPHPYLGYGGTWSTDAGMLNLTCRTRDDGVNFETHEFTLTGVPDRVGDGSSASPRLRQYSDTLIRTLKVDGSTLTLDADYQTRGRRPRALAVTATRQ